MKRLLSVALLLAMLTGGSALAQFSFSVGIGRPPDTYPVVVRPGRPSGTHIWVDGYWYPYGHGYGWRNGYWAVPPYSGATWVAPYYRSTRYHYGYWDGNHGRRYPDYRSYERYERDHRRRGHNHH
jgi:hypothetical protein